MIEAAIDIGTNTMLLLIADVDPAVKPGGLRRIKHTIDDQQTIVRLGQDVHRSRMFAPEAMARAMACFRHYRKVCDARGVATVHGVATSASRDASNAPEFYKRVREETGVDVRVVDGATEARLSFLGGLLPGQDPERSALIDIGGGSTEFVMLERGGGVRGQSLDMGCVRATEMFLRGDPYAAESLEAMRGHLRSLWKTLEPSLQDGLRERVWTAIAGTPTTLAAMNQDLKEHVAAKIDGYRLDRQAVGGWLESLAAQTQAVRAANPVIGNGRADILTAGAAILYTAMEVFGKSSVVVSSRGLRHGVILDPPGRGP